MGFPADVSQRLGGNQCLGCFTRNVMVQYRTVALWDAATVQTWKHTVWLLSFFYAWKHTADWIMSCACCWRRSRGGRACVYSPCVLQYECTYSIWNFLLHSLFYWLIDNTKQLNVPSDCLRTGTYVSLCCAHSSCLDEMWSETPASLFRSKPVNGSEKWSPQDQWKLLSLCTGDFKILCAVLSTEVICTRTSCMWYFVLMC